mmetsp:Transcript_103188/g.274363  ORF Transcript_103188/g.274363 Transcript_103188/m.274363 type:complete len:208 (+) Transcript_103188:1148-1771(+)
MVALPTGDVRTEHAIWVVGVLQLDGWHRTLLVLHLKAMEEGRLTLDEVVEVLVAFLLACVRDKPSNAEALNLLRLLAATKALLHHWRLPATARFLQALAQQPAGAATEALRVKTLRSARRGVLRRHHHRRGVLLCQATTGRRLPRRARSLGRGIPTAAVCHGERQERQKEKHPPETTAAAPRRRRCHLYPAFGPSRKWVGRALSKGT